MALHQSDVFALTHPGKVTEADTLTLDREGAMSMVSVYATDIVATVVGSLCDLIGASFGAADPAAALAAAGPPLPLLVLPSPAAATARAAAAGAAGAVALAAGAGLLAAAGGACVAFCAAAFCRAAAFSNCRKECSTIFSAAPAGKPILSPGSITWKKSVLR